MDLKTKKINFIKDFIELENEDLVDKLDKVLHSDKFRKYEKELKPMPMKDFLTLIDQAKIDVDSNNITSVDDLEKEVKQWH